MLQRGIKRSSIDRWIRVDRPPCLHRGVYGEADPLGHLMAAVLAAGPGAVLSHRSALGLWGMREHPEGKVDVSVVGTGGRAERDGFRIHRVRPFAPQRREGIRVSTPARSLVDAGLPRHEAYRALEAAEAAHRCVDYGQLTGPTLREVKEVLRLGMNRTRSDAEARFIFLCRDHRIEMPIVNHPLNGVEADFHWPRARLVLVVDGWAHHHERRPFEEDRRRGLKHRIAGSRSSGPARCRLSTRPTMSSVRCSPPRPTCERGSASRTARERAARARRRGDPRGRAARAPRRWRGRA
jgi:hypothetical protein